MALGTYPELVAAIANWAWRKGDVEFEAAVPEFIALTENVLNNGDISQGLAPLRVRDMEASAPIVLVNGVSTLPADYLELRSLTHDASGAEVPSTAYAISGDQIAFHDPAAFAGGATLHYYAKIPALTASSPTNWLIAKDHRVYLYGSLIQAAAFTREEQRMGYWGNLFISAVTGIAGSDTRSRFARSAVRPAGATP
jgi:hypothetical protein